MVSKFFDRQNCGRFLIEASCYSMQMQMLDIIYSYLNGEHLKGNDVTMKPYVFLKVFSGVVNSLSNDDLMKAAVKIFEKKNALSTFNDKHRMLDLLNRFTENRSIYSMPIKSLKSKSIAKMEQEVNSGPLKNSCSFEKSMPFQYNSGWMHLNTVSGTVEISVSTNGELKTVHIKPRQLQKIQIIE